MTNRFWRNRAHAKATSWRKLTTTSIRPAGWPAVWRADWPLASAATLRRNKRTVGGVPSVRLGRRSTNLLRLFVGKTRNRNQNKKNRTKKGLHLHCGAHLSLQTLLRPLSHWRARRPIPAGRLHLRPTDQKSNTGRTQNGRRSNELDHTQLVHFALSRGAPNAGKYLFLQLSFIPLQLSVHDLLSSLQNCISSPSEPEASPCHLAAASAAAARGTVCN